MIDDLATIENKNNGYLVTLSYKEIIFILN